MSSIASVLPSLLQYGYVALFLIMLLSAVYLPIPSSVALLVAGALAHVSEQGVHFNIFIVLIVGYAGNVLGDVTSYYIARQFGKKLRKGNEKSKHKYVAKIERYLKKYPERTIIVTRFIGFVSPIVNSISGYSKLPARTFIQSDLIGNGVYTIIFIGTGYLLGSINSHKYALISGVVTILVAFAVIYGGALLFLRRDK